MAAFPDAQIVQVVRDGRDTVADMLKDQIAMSWFRPSVANVDTEYPNHFYGVEDETDRLTWPDLSAAGKCAMRWRGAIRLAARLGAGLGVVLALAQMAEALAVRRPAWPWSRSLPWSAARRAGADALILGGHVLPLVLLVVPP